ncbi:MAG: porin, partial [Pseudomonadota bacterium]
GRLHVDTANYDDSGTALRNGSEVRRARLSLSSRYKDDFRFRGDYEFSDIGTGIKNLFVQYRGLDRWRLTVGHQIAPFGMEQQQSSNRLDLMERSLLQALTPAFHLGVGAQYRADRWFARFGVFDRNLDDAEARRARGKAFTGRIAGTPFRGDQWNTHIGASVEYRELDNDSLRFATRPESFVADTRLINTRTIDAAEQLATYGLEATASVGRCRAGGEYIVSHTSRTALPNLQFDGFYVQAACVLRGGNYEFRDNRGQFRPIQSRDSLGTVEVTTRLSRLDLNDKTVLGGRQTNTSIGVTWVPVESMRFLVNLVDYDASPNRNGAIDTGRLWQARLQFTF